MKDKIRTISVLGMILLAGLLSPAPASAETGSWKAEPVPGMLDKVLGPAGVDIRDIAVAADDTTLYAVPGDSISDNVVYVSTDTGTSWNTLDVNISADLVAVAPDDKDMVAITSSQSPEVYITLNRGSTWYTLGIPGENSAAAAIYDLSISRSSNGVCYIAAAGRDSGGAADVWYYETVTAGSNWKETSSLAGFTSADEIRAVAFSPNFPLDKTMVAVSEKDNASIDLQVLSLSSGQWNTGAGFTGYPVTIASGNGITGLASASLSLAPDYLASEPERRTVFVGLTVDGDAASSGIYRLQDTVKTALKTNAKIHSIAFNGVNLVAGSYDTTGVYRSDNPLAAMPAISTAVIMKEPGGENRVVIARAGNRIVAGTSGNESAFAVSGDNGATFNDISLIDTAIANARDVAVSADGSKVYLVTDDGNDLSLWRRASNWKRVFSRRGTADYIVRIAPEEADSIYLAKKNGTAIYHSNNGGDAAWLTGICRVNIRDLAVESADTAYALDGTGSVSKTTNTGLTWGAAIPTQLGSGATMVSFGNGNLLVGSQDGYVAYSTDGNTFWTRIPKALKSGAGNVQVIADKDFATNKIIYAADNTSGQDIGKWQVGRSTEWTDIFKNYIRGGVYGLAIDNGTLYALEFNAGTGQSALWQCLTPAMATSTSSSWSSSATTAYTDVDDPEIHLDAAPRALKSSPGKLWAVKTNATNKLYGITTLLITIGGRKPASGAVIPVNSITGAAPDIGFSWSRPSEATGYELDIALDEDCTAILNTVVVESKESQVFVLVGPNQTGDSHMSFSPGQTYFWRVRVTQPLLSQYSGSQSFTIEPLPALVPDVLTPANGSVGVDLKPSFSWSPVSGATEYRFMLGDNAELTPPIIDTVVKNAGFTMTEALDYGKTYFWKVRATEPVAGDWSTLSNFTVKKEPEKAVLPPVVPPAPPPVINIPEPEPPPPTTVTLPPPATPTSTRGYSGAAIIIACVLVLAVTVIIIRLTVTRPLRVVETIGKWSGNLGGGLMNSLKHVKATGAPRKARTRLARARRTGDSHSLSFAARSFLWMTTSGEKEEETPSLSREEELALGKILASRIRAIARENLLYRKYPVDASLFLYLWSRFGSRDETNRYLSDSFGSSPGNVIEFLKCYLTPLQGQETGDVRPVEFSRAQYDSVAEVVDPDEVFKALARLYGAELDTPESTESGSTDRLIASRFVQIHRRVKDV